MTEMLKRPETRFSDLVGMGINPKIVGECLGMMARQGLVIHERKGAYRLSKNGSVLVVALTRDLAKLIEATNPAD
jgi:Mn-dependent DtxR family transcriptional regulator